MTYRVLVTCPPMIRQLDVLSERMQRSGWSVSVPEFVQTVPVETLCEILPEYDAWIIGDDPACREVVAAGAAGNLKAAVKWGVGTDNVDFPAFEEFGIPVQNTPGAFGAEVADIALGYIIGLARQTFAIDRGVRAGGWPKPAGNSLAGKTVALVGFGDIGRQIATRALACGMSINVYDPFADASAVGTAGCTLVSWPERLVDADFLVLACALTPDNHHLVDRQALSTCKRGVRVVNVSRGGLIDEQALVDAQQHGVVEACALDVFEEEPVLHSHPLLQDERNIVGSHNASNTVEAVLRTSERAIDILEGLLSG